MRLKIRNNWKRTRLARLVSPPQTHQCDPVTPSKAAKRRQLAKLRRKMRKETFAMLREGPLMPYTDKPIYAFVRVIDAMCKSGK